VTPVRALNEELCCAHRTGKSGRERDLWLVAADRRKARNGSAQCAKIITTETVVKPNVVPCVVAPAAGPTVPMSTLPTDEYATNRVP
jgi:hypothetical protein